METLAFEFKIKAHIMRYAEFLFQNEENPMAIVRFTPSQVNPHGEFADEFYYPPNMRQGAADEQRNVASFANYGDGFRDELDSIGDPDKGSFSEKLFSNHSNQNVRV